VISPRRLRLLAILPFALAIAVVPRGALADSTIVSVPLNLPDATGARTSESDSIGKLAAKLVESSNFNSYHRPEVVGLSIPEIQDRYRRTAAGTNLVVTYPEPVKFVTEGGDLWVLEIVIGLGLPDRVDALFTIDNASRVVAHEKYSGALAVELRQAANKAANTP
jgi:hypothetical protein